MDLFLLLGDSITQQSSHHLAAPLAAAYIRRLDIVNRGLSGYNTRQALQLLPQLLPPPEKVRIRFLTIAFGANDARLPDTPGEPQQHVPLAEFAANLRAMMGSEVVRRQRAEAGMRVILVTTPPVDQRMLLAAGQAAFPEQAPEVHRRKAAVTAEYAAAVRKVGAEMGLAVLDIWTVMIEAAGGRASDARMVGSMEAPRSEVLQSFLTDGLHFSPEGYKVLYAELMALILRTWLEQMPDELPFVFPSWQDASWDAIR